MRLLLDTHILLYLTRGGLQSVNSQIAGRLNERDDEMRASVASLWEIAIKTRLGKLDPGMPLEDFAAYLEAIGLAILPIDHRHAVAWVDPEPATRDPFDRMLLAQCKIEDLRLVTLDRALLGHPLSLDLS
jgi:PIN domain nuclease of toxin-antitoxin system